MAKLRARTSEEWLGYFRSNGERLLELPWHDGPQLGPEELSAIAASVQEFQRGESSDGRRSLAIARAYAERSGDRRYPEAIAAFFAEEHRHAGDLGRFLELAGVPLLSHTWGDTVFRQLRRAFNLELLIAVLLTVELIALVYYRALHDATRSPLLRRICAQILRDERAHVQFHFERLALLRRFRPRWLTAACHASQRFLLAGTGLAVWRNHRLALRAGGFDWRRYWRVLWHEMGTAVRQLDPANYDFSAERHPPLPVAAETICEGAETDRDEAGLPGNSALWVAVAPLPETRSNAAPAPPSASLRIPFPTCRVLGG